MAAPPSAAEVEGIPPDPLPPDTPGLHSLSASEIDAMNLFIKAAGVQSSQRLGSSLPTNVVHSPTAVNFLHLHDSLASKPNPNTQLEQSFSVQTAVLGEMGKYSPAKGSVKECHVSPQNPFPVSGVVEKHPGQPTGATHKLSFAEMVKSGRLQSQPKNNLFGNTPPLPGVNLVTNDGVDVLMFDDAVTHTLSEPFKWALVGKFSHGVPLFTQICKFFKNLLLVGKCDLRWINPRQVLVVLSEEVDFVRIWLKGIWHVDGFPMRMLKWSPLYNSKNEPALVPVWAKLPGLPVHLYDRRALFIIASRLGKPIEADAATAKKSRVSEARFCVELDLESPHTENIVLGIGGKMLDQPVVYENLPAYCSFCFHVGHDVDVCYVKNVELKPAQTIRPINKAKIVGPLKVGDFKREHGSNIGAVSDAEEKVTLSCVLGSNHLQGNEVLNVSIAASAALNSNNGDLAIEEGEIIVVDCEAVNSGGVNGDVAMPLSNYVHAADEGARSGDSDIVQVNSEFPKALSEQSVVTGELLEDEGVMSVFVPLHSVDVASSSTSAAELIISNDVGSSVAGPDTPLQLDGNEDGVILDDRSTAIVNFLSPFGVGSNMASVMESDPVALIKFLDKHHSMELYWDENSVLQCVDKESGEYIDYAAVNSSEEHLLTESPALSNQTIVFAEPLQSIYQPHCYYPDMEALRAHLIPESDGDMRECSDSDSSHYYDHESDNNNNFDDFDEFFGSSKVSRKRHSMNCGGGSGNIGSNSGYG